MEELHVTKVGAQEQWGRPCVQRLTAFGSLLAIDKDPSPTFRLYDEANGLPGRTSDVLAETPLEPKRRIVVPADARENVRLGGIPVWIGTDFRIALAIKRTVGNFLVDRRTKFADAETGDLAEKPLASWLPLAG
ncbi:hypothetical protein GCM10007918_13910 [Piscinibacter gummiphilus]|nr:hypothetical protein GCM10007918_13910 [Piscinibacter gummiphilus]